MYLDPNKTPQIRNLNQQQPQYSRLTVNWNDAGITSGVKFARLPTGAFITSVKYHVTTAFNAATTNPVSIGTTQANANEVLAAIAGQTTGFTNATSAAGLGATLCATGPVDLWVKYAPTGGGQSAGAVTFIIEYILDNDL
jgi:hypothetical protein